MVSESIYIPFDGMTVHGSGGHNTTMVFDEHRQCYVLTSDEVRITKSTLRAQEVTRRNRWLLGLCAFFALALSVSVGWQLYFAQWMSTQPQQLMVSAPAAPAVLTVTTSVAATVHSSDPVQSSLTSSATAVVTERVAAIAQLTSTSTVASILTKTIELQAKKSGVSSSKAPTTVPMASAQAEPQKLPPAASPVVKESASPVVATAVQAKPVSHQIIRLVAGGIVVRMPSGEEKIFRVAETLPSGEKIVDVDEGTSTYVTDRGIRQIRVTQ